MAPQPLEYPRILRKPGGASVIVHSEAERDARIAEGWCRSRAEAEAIEPDPPEPEKPKHKGRGR